MRLSPNQFAHFVCRQLYFCFLEVSNRFDTGPSLFAATILIVVCFRSTVSVY